ncbi:hypothetical protein AAMO2058_000665000 [Amorphochlora amoebiformis]
MSRSWLVMAILASLGTLDAHQRLKHTIFSPEFHSSTLIFRRPRRTGVVPVGSVMGGRRAVMGTSNRRRKRRRKAKMHLQAKTQPTKLYRLGVAYKDRKTIQRLFKEYEMETTWPELVNAPQEYKLRTDSWWRTPIKQHYTTLMEIEKRETAYSRNAIIPLEPWQRYESNATVSTIAGKAYSKGCKDGEGSEALFRKPRYLAVDSKANVIYITDSNRIRRLSLDPTNDSWSVETLSGGRRGLQDGEAGEALFRKPMGLAINPDTSEVYVADSGNHAVRKITPQGEISTFIGPSTLTKISASLPGEATPLQNPQHIVISPKNNAVYVAERIDMKNDYTQGYLLVEGTRIRKFTKIQGEKNNSTTFSAHTLADGLEEFGDMVIDCEGRLFAAVRNRICMLGSDGKLKAIAGSVNNEPGYRDGLGSNALLRSPGGLSVVNLGQNCSRIFFTDGSNTVRIITLYLDEVIQSKVETIAGKGVGYINGRSQPIEWLRGHGGGYVDGSGELALFQHPTALRVLSLRYI